MAFPPQSPKSKELVVATKALTPVALFLLVIGLYFLYPNVPLIHWLWIALWVVIVPAALLYLLFADLNSRHKKK
jgi:hypothetical protein